MRKIRMLVMLAVITLCLLLLPTRAEAATVASGICGVNGDNLTWTLDDTGTLTISGTGDSGYYLDCPVPWDCHRDMVNTVVIQDGVSGIGVAIFSGHSNLRSITLPDSVTYIAMYAFSGCSSLTSITIPDSVTDIGLCAFHSCSSLTSITITDSVTYIGDYAFSGCDGLADVYYSGNADQWAGIGIGSGNDRLTSAMTHFGESDALVGSGTCGDNLTWTLDDAGTLTISGIGDMANYSYNGAPWYSNRSSIKTVSIQDGVTSIGDYAFYYCSSLTSITILDSVTSIGAGAFADCFKLTDIDIPNSVVHIGEDAFFYCERLTSVTLPDGITSISAGLFSNCGNLVSVDIPENVTSIGDYAFGECWSLSSIDIPASVASIGVQAFWYCESLTSVMLPNGITEIADGLFSMCSNLVSVNIPKGVTCIGYGSFRGCAITSIEIPNSVTSIADEAFYCCPSLTSITIPASVTSVGEYAFGACYSLSSVAIPDNLTNIAEGTFYECDSLTDVYYNGTAEQWASVSIGEENDALLNANIIYLGDSNFSVVTPNKEKHYLSLEDAIANAAGGYVCLYGNVTGNVSVSADTYLDLNGHTLAGDITIADGATLYVFDSAAADYTADNRGKIVGTITGELARTMNTPKDSYGHNYKYLTLKESDGSYSFHRYYLTVKSVVLVPYMKGEGYTGTAVDYKTAFKCNDVMAQYVTAYGTKLVGDNTVYADYIANGYSLLTGADNTNEQRTWLSGTFKSTNTAEQNATNALLAPTVSAYIMLSDGLSAEVTSAGVQRSLQDMIVYANGLDDLTTTEKAALGKMYDLFKDVLDSWTEVDITNIKRYAAELV